MRRTFGMLLAVALAACGSDATGPAPTDPQDVTYAAELNVDFSRMTQSRTGLWYEDIEVGTGNVPLVGDSVFVLYAGYLPDGTRFDIVDDPDDPLPFILGVDPIIDGFAEGVTSMRVGGIRRLVIPPQLGYGFQANGPIPGNSVLVFVVELLSFK